MESFLRDENVYDDEVIHLERQPFLDYAAKHGAAAALDRILSMIGASTEFTKRVDPNGEVILTHPDLTVQGSGNRGPLIGRGDDDENAKGDAFLRGVYPKRAQSKDPTQPHSPGVEDPSACVILENPYSDDLRRKIIKWNRRPNGFTAG